MTGETALLRARLHIGVDIVAEHRIVLPRDAVAREYGAVPVPEILPRLRRVAAEAPILFQRGKDRVVCSFVAGGHFVTALIQEVGHHGLGDIDIPVSSVRDDGGYGRLQAKDIVEYLFEFGSGEIGARHLCARGLGVAVVGRVRLYADLRAVAVGVAHIEFALPEIGVEKAAVHQHSRGVRPARRAHFDAHPGGIDMQSVLLFDRVLIRGLERVYHAREVFGRLPYGLIVALDGGGRRVIRLLLAELGVGVLIRAHGDGGEHGGDYGEDSHGHEDRRERRSPLRLPAEHPPYPAASHLPSRRP